MDTANPRVTGLARRHGVTTVDLSGLTFLDVDEARFVRLIVDECRAGRGGWVITPNTDIVRLAAQDDDVRSLVRDADALVADGMPLVWASHVQGTPLRERVCGSDLIHSVSAAAAREGLPVYLLGGADDTAEQTARILTTHHPTLRVVGTHAPPFGFERDPALFDAMARDIAACAPAIVFVALSFPKGERLIQRIRDARPDAWWIGVGAAFDFVSGAVKRAPTWMQRSGTEWLFRISQDPGRLARRYLIHDLPFVTRLFRDAIRQRWTR